MRYIDYLNIITKSLSWGRRKMFNNIGNKIKGFATFLTIIGIIASIIVGIILIISGASLYYGGGTLILAGILAMVVGSLISWISSFVLYGFGQLIDSTERIEYMVYDISQSYKNIASNHSSVSDAHQFHSSNPTPTPAPTPTPQKESPVKWRCPKCDTPYTQSVRWCNVCGEENPFFS